MTKKEDQIEPTGNSNPKSVELILEPKSSDIGAGFTVRRTLPSRHRRMVGPFIFFDHMGPVDFAPGKSMEVLPHPHIGLATVTYLFEGEVLHRDSVGSVQAIRPGAINWMVSGSGIVHSERTSEEVRASGQTLHGIQLWVALPPEREDGAPAFFHHPADTIPGRELKPGVHGRVLIGKAWDMESPVETYSRMLYAEIQMAKDVVWTLDSLEKEQAIYVAMGKVMIDGETHESGNMLVLRPGAVVEIRATEDALLMVLGGDSLGPRKIYWNFVHSDPDKIEQAKERWKAQTFPGVEGETEFVPLPGS